MKRLTLTLVAGAAIAVAFTLLSPGRAQNAGGAQRYECAIIKYDGPDRIQYITPEKSETVRLFKTGVELPKDIHDEEFCMMYAANKLAKEGWEPVTLHATRLVLRRPIRN